MDLSELQDAVLDGIFKQDRQGQAKNWLNGRYAQVYGLSNWTFKNREITVSIDDNGFINLPAEPFSNSFPEVLKIKAIVGRLGHGINYEFGEDWQTKEAQGDGRGYSFKVESGPPNIVARVTPIPDQSLGPWRLFYIARIKLLEDDTDEPLIPEEHQYQILVNGARAEGLLPRHDAIYQDFEQRYADAVDIMKIDYLSAAEIRGMQWGRA